jgi:hypothetical protein
MDHVEQGNPALAERPSMKLRDELANQASALLHVPTDETEDERAGRLDGYRRLLERYGCDTTGDEASIIARVGFLLGSSEADTPDPA